MMTAPVVLESAIAMRSLTSGEQVRVFNDRGSFEAAEKMAKGNDLEGALGLLKRAVDLDPELGIDPEAEAQKRAGSDTQ